MYRYRGGTYHSCFRHERHISGAISNSDSTVSIVETWRIRPETLRSSRPTVRSSGARRLLPRLPPTSWRIWPAWCIQRWTRRLLRPATAEWKTRLCSTAYARRPSFARTAKRTSELLGIKRWSQFWLGAAAFVDART